MIRSFNYSSEHFTQSTRSRTFENTLAVHGLKLLHQFQYPFSAIKRSTALAKFRYQRLEGSPMVLDTSKLLNQH